MDSQTAKARSKRLTEYFESYTCYDRFINQSVPVWVSTEIGKAKDGSGQSVGHTKEYVKVVFPRDDNLIGKRVIVKITAAEKFHISGEVV